MGGLGRGNTSNQRPGMSPIRTQKQYRIQRNHRRGLKAKPIEARTPTPFDLKPIRYPERTYSQMQKSEFLPFSSTMRFLSSKMVSITSPHNRRHPSSTKFHKERLVIRCGRKKRLQNWGRGHQLRGRRN